MRKLEIKGTLGVFLLLAVMMGCDATFSGGRTGNVTVQYFIIGDQISNNANYPRDYTTADGTSYLELTWFCGNYKESQNSLIQLTFKKENNTNKS